MSHERRDSVFLVRISLKGDFEVKFARVLRLYRELVLRCRLVSHREHGVCQL